MIWTDDQVRSLYGDRLSTTAATMAPPGSGCSGTNPLHGVFSDTDPIIIVHVHVCVGGEEEIMCLGPLDPEVLAMTPHLGSFRRR